MKSEVVIMCTKHSPAWTHQHSIIEQGEAPKIPPSLRSYWQLMVAGAMAVLLPPTPSLAVEQLLSCLCSGYGVER